MLKLTLSMQLQRNTKLIETVFVTGSGKSNREQLKKRSSGKRKILDGRGRHITFDKIEENLLEWIFDQQSKGLRGS